MDRWFRPRYAATAQAGWMGGDAMKWHRLLWVQESTTSIAWLDDEHRDLVDHYQAVVDALREDNASDAFVERLIDLREWLSRHSTTRRPRYSRSAARKPTNTEKIISSSLE